MVQKDIWKRLLSTFLLSFLHITRLCQISFCLHLSFFFLFEYIIILHDYDPGVDNTYNHLILLAKNNEGYKNLSKMVSLSFVEGYYYKPRIDKELLEKYRLLFYLLHLVN